MIRDEEKKSMRGILSAPEVFGITWDDDRFVVDGPLDFNTVRVDATPTNSRGRSANTIKREGECEHCAGPISSLRTGEPRCVMCGEKKR